MACVVNREDGQKGLDVSLRKGEGTIGLQGCRVGCVEWAEANLRSGFERLLGRTGAGLIGPSRSSSASSASTRVRIKGVLGKGNGRVGEVGPGGRVGGGVVGVGGVGGERIEESDALVCMERAADTLGAKLR